MTSVAGDYCDYHMGDYNCSEGFYGYEVEGDYGGYENGHGENIGRFEDFGFERENEVNEVPSAYGDFGDDVVPREGSYDEVGTCEESCTPHSEPRLGVRNNPFIRKSYESYDESTREECDDSYSPPCSTSYQGRYGVNDYTSYSVGRPRGRRGSTSSNSRGTHVPYNVDPRRSVHSGKVTICGIPGCLIVLNDRYYKNYIVPSMVDYLGLFCEPLLVPYFLDRFKVTKRVKVVFSQFNYHEEVWCDVFPITYGHVSLGADWFAQHKVPNVQNWPNIVRDRWGNCLETYILPGPQKEVPTYSNPNYYERQKIERSKGVKGGNPRVEKGEVVWSEVRGLPPNQANVVCPSISKDTCVGSNMESEEEQCRKEVAAQTFGGPSHHDKEESTHGLQVNDELKATGNFEYMDLRVDEAEHSMEMHLPYLAKVFQGYPVKIVPILVGALSAESEALFGRLLAKYLNDSKNFFSVSSDFCHWGSRFNYMHYDKSHGVIYKSIEALDKMGMDIIETGDPDAFKQYLSETDNTICGRHPISVFLHMLKSTSTKIKIRFLRYEQSSQCKSMRDSSVSYASAVGKVDA